MIFLSLGMLFTSFTPLLFLAFFWTPGMRLSYFIGTTPEAARSVIRSAIKELGSNDSKFSDAIEEGDIFKIEQAGIRIWQNKFILVLQRVALKSNLEWRNLVLIIENAIASELRNEPFKIIYKFLFFFLGVATLFAAYQLLSNSAKTTRLFF